MKHLIELMILIFYLLTGIPQLTFGQDTDASQLLNAAKSIRKLAVPRLMTFEDFQVAEVLLNEVIRNDPNNSLAHFHLGYLYSDRAFLLNELRTKQIQKSEIDSVKFKLIGEQADSLMKLYRHQAKTYNELINSK